MTKGGFVKKKITKEDVEFVDHFLSNELTEEGMNELDVRLQDSSFKAYYEERLNKKYKKPVLKVFTDYLPMLIMLFMLVFGVYLLINSK